MPNITGEAYFNNGITVAGGGNEVLFGLLSDVANQKDIMRDFETNMEKMGYVNQIAQSKDEKFTQIAPPEEMDDLVEDGVKPELESEKMPNKGYLVKEYGNKIKISKLMRKWLERNEYIGNASSDVQAEFRQLFNGANNLIYSAKMRMAMEMLKVWTKGFGEPTSEYGAGSPTPHGLPLFSVHHPFKRYSGEYRNMGSGAYLNAPLTADSLQDSLECFNTEIKGENGHGIITAKKSYKLFISRKNLNNARRILNATQSGTPSPWSGVGVNANQTNQFIWNGNTVEIVVLEYLGDKDKYGNSIGSPSMRFVLNEEPMLITRAFRKIELRPLELNNWMNEDTGSMFVGADCAKAFDHYGAEVAIFGSKGDGDTSYSY